jgi:hypothetical protein
MIYSLKTAVISVAALGAATLAVPASAYEMPGPEGVRAAPAEEQWNHRRDRDRDRYDRRYSGRGNDRYYGDRVHRNTRVWRGQNGRYYCRKDDGTTGLLIGAAVGGLIGNEVAGRGDKTLGVILGAVGGGFLGREIDRSDTRCR